VSLRVVYTDDFPADVAEQARWYARQRDEALALDYARAVEATLEFLAQNPQLGSLCHYREPKLADLRFYLVEKPFDRHLIYYRISGEQLVAFRVVPGARDLPRRLLDPPGAE
jgi:plasmid stabilization system protein ParE